MRLHPQHSEGGARWLLILACLASTTAFAQESDHVYEENRNDTLHYRVPRGHFQVNLGTDTFLRDHEDVFAPSYLSPSIVPTASGVPTSAAATTAAGLSLAMTYGLSDTWSISLSDRVSYAHTVTTPSSPDLGTRTSTNSGGPSSPTLSLSYRILGALHDKLFLAAGLGYTPSFGGLTLADSQQTGSQLSPWHTLSANLWFGAVIDTIEVSAQAVVRQQFAGTFTASTAAGSYTSAPFLSGTVDLGARLHFLDHFFASADLGLHFGNSITYTYPNNPFIRTHSMDTAPYMALACDFGWRINERTVVTVGYSHTELTRTAPNPEDSLGLSLLGYSPTSGRVEYAMDVMQLGAGLGW